MRMLQFRNAGSDHIGAALMIAIGAFVIVTSVGYQVGSLTKMGAGFFPLVLGILLLLTGVAIGLTASPREEPRAGEGQIHHHGGAFEGRSWLCIVGGLVAFIVLAEYGGMVPASFASVFLAALGDRENSVKQAALIGLAMVAIYIVIFYFGLKLPQPLFRWG